MTGIRKQKRRHLIYYLKVYDRETGKQMGHLADITVKGARLITDAPLEEKIRYGLKLTLPEGMEAGEFLELDARCVWCDKDVNPEHFAAGLQLVKPSPEDIHIIERLVEWFGFND